MAQLSRVEHVHSRHFIHRDIKPANFVMGVGERSNQAYIIDFGLAKQYRDSQTHHHIPCEEHYSLVGTIAFASINNHLGLAPSRRDDLESLAYVLLYFLRGSLPWYGDPSKKNPKQPAAILRKKLGALADHMFDSLPGEFTTFLSYTRALGFDEEPDYTYIRTLFRDLLIREGYLNDCVFDWCVEATDQKDIATAMTTGRRARKENNRTLTSDRVYVPSLAIQSYFLMIRPMVAPSRLRSDTRCQRSTVHAPASAAR